MVKKLIKIVLISLFLLPNSVFATTYATWNPSDKASDITLSNGNLSAVNGAAGLWRGVRSTIGKSSGKWYWEITWTGADAADKMTSIANTTASLTNFFGSDVNGWGYYNGNGDKYNNGTGVAYGSTYDVDIIGVALDMDAGTITFYKNGVSQGQAFTGLTGTIYAGISINQTGITATANFGASAFTYTPPAGYCAGLVDVCPSASTAPTNPLVFSTWW